ncbi:MAG: DUF4878 domain-containing protein [Chlorobi bacterium]|nr:DUF4878 domain-containing protein [Chlorobiota bacterium]
MKKLAGIGIILVVTFFMAACGGSSSNPQNVAKDFFKALSEKNYDKAKDLGTDNTAMMIGMIESFAKMAPEGQDTDSGMGDLSAIKWGETKVKGDSATCFYSTPDKENQTIALKKVDGKWKVDMKKDI